MMTVFFKLTILSLEGITFAKMDPNLAVTLIKGVSEHSACEVHN
jgi:hypothetical protein